MKSLLLLATAQALLITTSIISINCFVIGINPLNTYKRLRAQWRETDDFYDNLVVSDTNVIPGLPKGTKYGDLPEDLQNTMFGQSVTAVVLLDLIKVLGLSDKTILIIEQDLRNQ